MARIRSRKKREEEKQQQYDVAVTRSPAELAKEQADGKIEEVILFVIFTVREHIRLVALGGGALLLAFILGAVWQAVDTSNENEATLYLDKLRDSFGEMDLVEVEEERNKLRKKYIGQLADFRKKYDGTKAYSAAGIYQASFHQFLGEYKEAAKLTEEFAGEQEQLFLKGHYFQVAASYHEQAGDAERAAKLYEAVDNLVDDNLKSKNDVFTVNYYQKARIAEKAGNIDEALKLYNKALGNISDANKNESGLKKMIRSRYLFLKHSEKNKKKKEKKKQKKDAAEDGK